MEVERKVGSDGCVRMFKKRFEIPDALPGSKVKIYYFPWEKKHIMIGDEKVIAKPLDTQKNAKRFEKPNRNNNNQSIGE